MRSGRHGAARPPIAVLIQQDRLDFILLVFQILVAAAVMVVTGPLSLPFWLAFLLLIASIVLAVRRIDRLSRQEVAGDELL
ncbi:hypothetical protein [Salinactinospora qingdaonensis]|uniref:Sensor histidine kinase n=1 Tax=Salinactinospora qingdaonensis TaxID=702744 RepID=A0ABP7FMB9_9ACTN